MVNFNDIQNTQETFVDYVFKKEMDDFLHIITDVMHNYDEIDFVNTFDLWGSNVDIYTDYEKRQIKLTDQHNDHNFIIVTFLGGYNIVLNYSLTFNLNVRSIKDFVQTSKQHKFKFKVKEIQTNFVDIVEDAIAWTILNNSCVKAVLGKIKTNGIEITKMRWENVDPFITFCKCLLRRNKDCVINVRKSYFNDLFDGYLDDLEKFYDLFKLKNAETGYYQIIKKETPINENLNFNDVKTEETFSKTLSIQADIKRFLDMYKFGKMFANADSNYRHILECIFSSGLSMPVFDLSHKDDGYIDINHKNGLQGRITFLGNREIKLKTNKAFSLNNDFLRYNAMPNPMFKVVEMYCGNQIVHIGSGLVDDETVTVPMIKKMPKLIHSRVYHIGFSQYQNVTFDVIKTLYDICSSYEGFLSFDVPYELLTKYGHKIYKVFDTASSSYSGTRKLIKKV